MGQGSSTWSEGEMTWAISKRLVTLLNYMRSVAPEAVWQVGRPPYQSEIWYGGAIPIRDAGISLVLIPKTRYSITSFLLLLYQLLLLIDILIISILTYLLT